MIVVQGAPQRRDQTLVLGATAAFEAAPKYLGELVAGSPTVSEIVSLMPVGQGISKMP